MPLLLSAILPVALVGAPDATTTVNVNGTGEIAVGSQFGVTVSVSNTGDEAFLTGDSISYQLLVQGGGNTVFSTGGNIANGLGVGAIQTQTFTFTMPYGEAIRFNAGWTALSTVSATRDTNTTNNQATANFNITVPDLQLLNLQGTGDVLPGQDATVTFGTVNNPATGNAGTDPAVLLSAEALLVDVASGLTVDREAVLVNSSSNGITAGGNIQSTISNLHIPSDANPGDQFTVQVTVDPGNPGLVVETNEANNDASMTLTVGGASNLQFVSFTHDEGTFFAGDPIQISLTYQNAGTAPIPAAQVNTFQVALSFDNSNLGVDDFILRRINASGNNQGSNLHPGETVTLDWVQRLPESYQGTFYVLAENNGNVRSSNSPTVTILSTSKGMTSVASTNTTILSDAPSSSADGKAIAYESIVGGISQLFLKRENDPPIQITQGNAGSYSPSVSGDGEYVAFHSYASNLAIGDNNGMADVFTYDSLLNRISRVSKSSTGGDSNGGSFYPSIDYNGSKIVFESLASNLGEDPNPLISDIFIYDSQKETSQCITYPNASGVSTGSYQPSISFNGKRVAFFSHSSNLISLGFPEDNNGYSDVFLWEDDDNKTCRLSRTVSLYKEVLGGHSSEPEISGDGKYVAFQSRGRNLVSGKGVVSVTVTDSGAGYSIPPTVTITDSLGPGFGATAFANINSNGEVTSITLSNPGAGFIQPMVSIVQSPLGLSALPREANATANLSHEEGDVYLVDVDKIIRFDEGNFTDVADAVVRISETADGLGGNSYSRQPTINFDGSLVAYRTQASSFLDGNITRVDGKTFYNSQTDRATASLILGGSITEIEVADAGLGYEDGFLRIFDSSGSGLGASATYVVDGAGRIVNVSILDAGTGYNPNTTQISVDNPRNGIGFQAGAIRHSGSVLQVQLNNNGLGYPKTLENKLPSDFRVRIDGDGSNALMNKELVRVGETGELLFIQKATIALVNINALQSETLIISDRSQSLTITFDQTANVVGWDPASKKIGGFNTGTSPAIILGHVVTAIQSQWGVNSDSFSGVVATLSGSTLELEAITGRFVSSNTSALSVVLGGNLLTRGTGYEFGAVSIGPDPVIYGYSEISEDFTTDTVSSDIYLFHRGAENGTGRKNERVSVSSFGYPVRSFGEPSSPASVSPSISANGRYVFFSTDANGLGGIAFGINNQSATDGNGLRDVYVRDRKASIVLPHPYSITAAMSRADITMHYPNAAINHPFSLQSSIPVVVQANISRGDISRVQLFVDGNNVGNMTEFTNLNSGRFTFRWNATVPGKRIFAAVAFDAAGVAVGETQPVEIDIKSFSGSRPPTATLKAIPAYASNGVTSHSTIMLQAEGIDSDGDFVGMQFFVDGNITGTEIRRNSNSASSSVVYSTRWDLQDSGMHSVFAIGRDNSGNYVATGIESITSTGGTGIAPTIDLHPLPSSASQDDSIRIIADANDSDGEITSVEFFLDGASLGVDTVSAYAANWNLNAFTQTGVHDIYAVARDDDGNYVTSPISRVSVGRELDTSIHLIAPSPELEVSEGSPFHFVAEVNNAENNVRNIRLLINSQIVDTIGDANRSTNNRFMLTWANTVEGNHTVHIEVADQFNNSVALSSANVIVKPSIPHLNIPNAFFRYPEFEQNGTSLTDTSEIYLVSQVGDLDGNLTKVEFFQDSNSTPIDTVFFPEKPTSPAALRTAFSRWSPPGVGSYSIYAVATDPDGNVGMSEVRTIHTVPGKKKIDVDLLEPFESEANKTIIIRPVNEGASVATGRPVHSLRRPFGLLGGVITHPGANYVSAPEVKFYGSGTGARATAVVDLNKSSTTYGQVTEIVMASLPSGRSYFSTTMELSGGHGAQSVFVNASSTEKNLSEIRLFDNGIPFSSSSTAPFGAHQEFNIGRHQIFAEIIDIYGNHGVSDYITVDVEPFTGIRPSVEIKFPAAGDIGNLSYFPLIANAFDTDGADFAPSRVTFYLDELNLGDGLRIAESHYYRLDFNASKFDWGDYSIRAVARDGSDNYMVSNPINIHITEETQEIPEVHWMGPHTTELSANGTASTTFSLDSTISLSVSTKRMGSAIDNVTFIANGEQTAVSGAPAGVIGDRGIYFANWTPTLSQVHEVWGVVKAGDTLISTSLKTFSIDAGSGSKVPIVQMTHPSIDDMFTATSKIRLSASASDPDGSLEGVQFFVNGANGWIQYLSNPVAGDKVVISDGNSTTEFSYGDTVSIGSSTKESRDNLFQKLKGSDLNFEASSFEDHTILINFQDTSAASITTLGSNALQSQFLPVSKRVSPVYLDTLTYSVDWSPGLPGTYVIYSVATDNSGNRVMSTPITVTSAAGKFNLPKVVLAPLNDVQLINDAIFLQATVTDKESPGSSLGIQRVHFLVNGVAQGAIDTLPPYFTTWTPTRPGLYEVVAYARDDDGNIAFSNNVEQVIVFAETSEVLAFTSFDRLLSGEAKARIVITKKGDGGGAGKGGPGGAGGGSGFRRSAIGETKIEGLSSKFLSELVPGQKIRFVSTQQSSDVYTVAQVVNDAELDIQEVLSDADFILLSNQSNVQVVEIYRATSTVFLSVDQDMNKPTVASVRFYVDGTLVATDTTWPFSSRFRPVVDGNYSIHAVSTDRNGIEKLIEKRIEVLPQVGELPQGSYVIHPTLVRPGATTRGSQLIADNSLIDLDDGINRVEFYLNGKFFHLDDKAPFYSIFSPYSPTSSWEMTMVCIDNSDNRISTTLVGTVAGGEGLPQATMISPLTGTEYTLGQVMNITVQVQGVNLPRLVGPNAVAGNNPNAGQEPRRMAIFANGKEIGLANETSFGSGRFTFEWSTKQEVAGNDNKVDLFGQIVMQNETIGGMTYTPSIVSSPITITLTKRNPFGDMKSAVSQFYKDLLFYEPSEQEVALSLDYIGSGTYGEYIFDNHSFLEWASNISQRQSFQDLVSAVAGYYITMGYWPSKNSMDDALQTYSAIPNYGTDGSGDVDGDGYSTNQEVLWKTSDTNATDFPENAFVWAPIWT